MTAGVTFYLAGSRTSRTATRRALAAPTWLDAAVIVGACVFAALIARYALEAFPLSADEYGYNFVADTLLHGTLWNQAYPLPLRDVLESVYIGGHGDQRVSQYTPGWPVFLNPFKLIGLAQLANPVLGLFANVFLFLALRRLALPRTVSLAALLFAAAAPFTLFNNASFFSIPTSAASNTAPDTGMPATSSCPSPSPPRSR